MTPSRPGRMNPEGERRRAEDWRNAPCPHCGTTPRVCRCLMPWEVDNLNPFHPVIMYARDYAARRTGIPAALLCRTSDDDEADVRSNARQVRYATLAAADLGFDVVHVHAFHGTGTEPEAYLPALPDAVRRLGFDPNGFPLIGTSVTRFGRPQGFHLIHNPDEPATPELAERWRDLAGSMQLLTLVKPWLDTRDVKRYENAGSRGVAEAGGASSRGARYPFRVKYAALHLLGNGVTLENVARLMMVSTSTLARWAIRAGHIHFPTPPHRLTGPGRPATWGYWSRN